MKRLVLLPALLLPLLFCACTGPTPQTTPTPTAPVTAPPPTATPAPAPTAPPATAPVPTEEPDLSPTAETDDILSAGDRDYPASPFSGDLTGGGLMEFSCLVPAVEVTAEFDRNAWVFRLEDEPEAFLELSFIAGGDVESLLPGFLDGYLEFTEIEFSETSALGSLRGEVGRVSASGPDRMAEGWLLDVEGGVLSAAVVCPSGAQEAKALFLAMLDTFRLD